MTFTDMQEILWNPDPIDPSRMLQNLARLD